jgi:Fe2+ transport system protein B
VNLFKTINRFLAAIMVVIYHLLVGSFMPRDSLAYIISMYIFVLAMVYVVGLPVDEESGKIQEDSFEPTIDLGRNP